MEPPPPYTAVVLAGGRAMLHSVLAAVADAERRVVVGPPQPVPPDVLLVRERPPGGGPVAALRAGLAPVDTDVVAVLAGDLPFVAASLIEELRTRLTGDGILVVDDAGRDQYLLGVWRTAALRAAVADVAGPTSLRRILAPLTVRRWHPAPRPSCSPTRPNRPPCAQIGRAHV